ncbi:MAG: LPS export ABC transporter periplasmic protein LptC [Pleurocapsa sp. SU_5_0]|nr:LPS export ABC transporter periplasmic protein LptC [Pleurocapsa sp. SU_5_0]NJO96913.1 LPS export ABC transporter periplasmic protein LptC [Pleurocapsa sp. CRU_1_2]
MLILLISITGCQSSSPDVDLDRASEVSRLDTQLVLNNAVLEQSNKKSNTVWKIKADKIVYSEDKQTATLDQVVGNLLQNGAVILKVSAESGEVKQQGNIILLNNKVIASDPRNGSVISSEAVEWRPQDNLMLIKSKLTGNNPNLEVFADSGKYFTDIEKLEIQDNVVATSKQPPLQLTSDRLEWNIPAQQIISPGDIKLVHYDQNQTIIDQLVSDRAELNLRKKQATLTKNIDLITSDPQLQIATDFLIWNYQTRIGKTDRPIQILNRDRHISLTGNKGEINLPQQLAKLEDGVRGINQVKAAELYARQITWNIDTEEIEAMGSVIYEQADPKARLTGEKASGALGDNNIVVTSDGKQPVTSVIDN